jgi:hypothetical protein
MDSRRGRRTETDRARGHGWTRRALSALSAFALAFASLLGIAVATAPTASAASDSLGTDYWLTFLSNYTSGTELTLFITGSTTTTGTVAIPGLSFSEPFTVTPGTVTSVTIPSTAELAGSDTVSDQGIHVTAGAEVSVYGLSRIPATTDAYLGLPTDILGTEYIVQGYESSFAMEFGAVATQDNTTVTIVPRADVGSHLAGVPFDVALNQGQTYQLQGGMSGTIVTANKPIAVFAGNQCANIPDGFSYCDHIVEEMTPTVTWGKSFVTEPLATRLNGDTFRYLASTDNTVVSVNGATVATLNRGQFFEQILTTASTITSTKPILVTQYSNSTSFDGVTSDPFEVIVPPYEQFLNSYTVTTPASGFDTNFINVVAPSATVGSVTLDGTAIPAASFTPIPGSGFSGAQVAVALGSHTLGGPAPFGITVYGFAVADSYGYPGGLSLAPVATVTNLDLTPATSTGPINTQHCVTGTVTDQNNVPVVGVRVDYTVTGVNPTSGFQNTAANGTSQFCYTGTAVGNDAIQAAVGTVTDNAARTWTAVAPVNHTLTVSTTGSGSVASTPAGISCPGTCAASFVEGTSVSLTPTPAPGFQFTGWGGACSGSAACVVVLNADASVSATFTAVVPVNHTLSVSTTGSGSVTSSPSGITCPGTCSASFGEGTSVTLTATPASGFELTGWGGACSGTGACVVALNTDVSVSATFTAIPPPPVNHTLSVSTTGSGSVTSSPSGISCPGTCATSFLEGTSVTLTPTPASGFAFTSWGGSCEGSGACVVALNADASVSATFTAITPPPDGNISVTEVSAPPTVTAGSSVQQTFTVTNLADGAQTDTSFVANFPAGSTIVSNAPGQGTCTAGPATLTCSLGTIPASGTVTIAVVVTVPAGFPTGVFAPTAAVASTESGNAQFGDLPGSNVVAPGNGQAFGFVAPGGTLTTGDATPANPTAGTFTLPNTGGGVPISLTTEPTTPTYCGGSPCRGRLLTLSPFGGGYDDPMNAPKLDISLDRSVVRRYGPSWQVWVQKEDSTVAPQLVPDCRSVPVKTKYKKWGHWFWNVKFKKVADPSPCVSKRYFDCNGDSHVEILVLSGDPKFGRR